MTHNEYNGWHNYETWLVNLWLTNDSGSDEYWREAAQSVYDNAADGDSYESQTRMESAACKLADLLKQEHEEAQPETTGLWADMINAAMSEVNWYEIAESLLEDVDTETEN